jgi:hypothetical protein
MIALAGLIRGPSVLFGDGRSIERERWMQLWIPMIPAALALGCFIGWAIQEPERSDELLQPGAPYIAALFAAVWLRAIVRAVLGLRVPRSVLAGTIGLIRPRAVFSAAFLSELDEDSERAARAHEQAHVDHHDPLRIWLARIATDLQWPFPWAARRLQAWLWSLELARDEEARLQGVDGADLAAAILTAARLTVIDDRRLECAGAIAPIEGHRCEIEERVRRLLAPLAVDVGGDSPRRRSWIVALIPAWLSAIGVGTVYGDELVRLLPGIVL